MAAPKKPNPVSKENLRMWKPGESGNPGGMTAQQAAKRKENRDRAFAIEERLLEALKKDMDENEAAIIAHIKADVLKLIHTAIEREDGKPVARVDNTSSDGSHSGPAVINLVPVRPHADGS